MADSAIAVAPDPSAAADLAEFIEQLRLLRAYAGNPSFRVLAKRVGPLLRPPQELTHSTVSDAFDPTRRRLNQELVAAIVQALGVPEDRVAVWRAACVRAHAAGRPAGTAGVFRQLPAELATFTGRQEQLAALLALADQVDGADQADRADQADQIDGAAAGAGHPAGPRTVVVAAIEGMAGVGKTQLAIRTAHELVRAGRFADVQLYVNLRGFDADAAPADPAEVLDSFLRQLEVPARQIPAGRAERAAMFRDRIAGRAALIVLDNAADEAQIADLIPAGPRCLVLATSRRSLAGLDGAHLFRLDVFPPHEALDLLGRVVGAQRVAAEPEAAEEVVRRCGLLPLAVALAAARLRSRPAWGLARLAAYLRDSGLDAVRAGGRELRPVFELSYRDLPPRTARAFRLLSLHPGRGFTPGAVAALAGTSEADARTVLEVLLDENLVEQRTADRYELHDLLHAFALERVATDEDEPARAEAVARLLSWYLHTAENVSRAVETRRLLETVDPRPDEPEPPHFATALDAMAWYDAERENLSGVVAHAAATGHHAIALRLPVVLLGCYQLRKDWPRWRAGYEAGLASAREVGDRAAESRLLNGLGLVLFDVRAYEQAIDVYTEALALAEELDNRPQVASILGNIGDCHCWLGDLTTAETVIKQSLEIFYELGNPQNLASSLCNYGVLLHEAERDDEAHATYTEALAASRAAGNRRYEAIIAFNRAEVCVALDRPADAEEDYRLALKAAQEAGDRPTEAETLRSLARLLAAHDRPAEALTALTEALTLLEALGSPEAAAVREELAALTPSQG
ncbi:tetratricopeptide repeat protein [Catenulispora subtropica]|uniref:XRE family transcriptional regulator n=1 Tax=Catenulispora subtropica TaxID=450798 RepID=A0ABN2QII4_9ACTN